MLTCGDTPFRFKVSSESPIRLRAWRTRRQPREWPTNWTVSEGPVVARVRRKLASASPQATALGTCLKYKAGEIARNFESPGQKNRASCDIWRPSVAFQSLG